MPHFHQGYHLHSTLQDRITIHSLKSFQFLIYCTQLISKSYYFILGNINHNSSLNYSLHHPSQDLHPLSTIKLKTSHINLLPPIFSFSNSSYILAMWSWRCHLISVTFNFLIYKIEVIKPFTLIGYFKDLMGSTIKYL